MQFLKYLLVSPIIKLAWAVVFAPVLVINKSFRDDFRQQKFFYRENWNNVDHQFQNERKNWDIRTFSEPLTSQTGLLLLPAAMRVQSAFQFGFLPSKPCFLLENRPCNSCWHGGEETPDRWGDPLRWGNPPVHKISYFHLITFTW